jgi:hypothetical protein
LIVPFEFFITYDKHETVSIEWVVLRFYTGSGRVLALPGSFGVNPENRTKPLLRKFCFYFLQAFASYRSQRLPKIKTAR